MNKIKTQRGFATFEIILVAVSLAILSTIALPNMARTLDKVRLDYEMKHLYSDLNLAQDLSRSISYNPTSIGGGSYISENIKFKLNYKAKRTEILCTRNGTSDLVFNRHKLSDGISFENTQGTKELILGIGNSHTIHLVSKFGKAKVVLDSVGRVRGAYE